MRECKIDDAEVQRVVAAISIISIFTVALLLGCQSRSAPITTETPPKQVSGELLETNRKAWPTAEASNSVAPLPPVSSPQEVLSQTNSTQVAVKSNLGKATQLETVQSQVEHNPPPKKLITESDYRAIFWNIVGGIIVAASAAYWGKLLWAFRNRQLQRLLGIRFSPATFIRIVYAQFTLPPLVNPDGTINHHPYQKPPRQAGALLLPATASIENPVSECEIRSTNYIASLLGMPTRVRTALVSDVSVDELLESSFISFGGVGSNYKTADILASPANIFIQMTDTTLTFPAGVAIPHQPDALVDCGFILRITRSEHHTWIVCAGIGEWGTSGAAWYLAYRWKQLSAWMRPSSSNPWSVNIPDFLAIVTVTRGQDESAQAVELYINRDGERQTVEI